MKKYIFIIVLFFIVGSLSAQMTVNGILDSSVSMTAGDEFSFGVEEFANIRFQSRLRDNKAVVYGAVNLIAAAGNYASAMAAMNPEGIVAGENYAAAIELERLYFRLNFEAANFDGGLMRLPFGYGQVWGSSDFLNPRNPLKPDARPRGILGAAVSWFPKDDIKLISFAAAPRNPFLSDGSGVIAGISIENHWNKASIQALYSYETPNEGAGSKNGLHRAGLSIKADVEVGLVLDALYTYNYEADTKWDGLSLSIGADYSFFGGKLIVLAEYLYNGELSSTSFDLEKNLLGMPDRHYLFNSFTWLFNDFTNLNIALVSNLSDFSFTPIITLNHDLFQGAVLTISAQIPLPPEKNAGNYFHCTARVRLRF